MPSEKNEGNYLRRKKEIFTLRDTINENKSNPSSHMELKQAHRLVADLMKPKPAIYWIDLLISSGLGWGSLYFGTQTNSVLLASGAFIVSVLSLYRSLLFIHELTHLNRGSVPGFHWGWNILVGIPLMVPSFMYIGVHKDHHNPRLFGTKQDPEYHPLSGSSLRLVIFMIVSMFAMPLLWLRFAILGPLSALSSAIRRITVERFSALCINPEYLRQAPKKEKEKNEWLILETATVFWVWSISLNWWMGAISTSSVCYAAGALTMVALLNQGRTVLAHRFDNHDHHSLTIEEQLLDSINYPTTNFLTEFWAPLGLRYHGLHHWLPGLPYHSLAKAHKILTDALPEDAVYHRASSNGPKETLSLMVKDERP